MRKMTVGVVGCGNISDIYLESPQKFPFFEITSVADLDSDRAIAKAEKHGIEKVATVNGIITDPDIDIILNLTVPGAHYSICAAAIAQGKHVFVEKPLSISLEEGRALIAAAKEKNVRVGCAPDTFLGGGLQTCRQLIDQGAIGKPIGAAAFMMGHGPEAWHPDPEFFYKPGGGPLFDMGPYYLTALVNMLGPISGVSAMSRISFPTREIGIGEKKGNKIKVETPTHITGSMEFASGVIGTLAVSFDVWHSVLPRIEVYGSTGTMSVPDPNSFGGPVLIRTAENSEWEEMKIESPYTSNSRGIGLSEMAQAIAENRPHRASGDLGLHVLETMHAFITSSTTRHYCALKSTLTRPEPLPVTWP
jgi:predicted dehydrogenase